MRLRDLENSTLLAGLLKSLLKLFFISCLVPSLAWANSYSTLVFGPVSYERGDAKPIPVYTNFSVPDAAGSFQLRIQNGDPTAVTSAVIRLNGETVAGPNYFNKQLKQINVPVQLLSENTLSVELRGEPGSGITIRIIEQIECLADVCAPHSIHPVLETQYRVSAMIPTTGGTISTVAGNGTAITLTIPDGSLIDDSEIIITPVSDISGLPLTRGLGSAVQFEPEGLLFSKPAVLTLDILAGIDVADLIGFGWSGSGDNFHLQPISVTGSQVLILISHFSGSGVGAGNVDNAAAAGNSSDRLGTPFINKITAETKRLENDPAQLEVVIQAVLVQWAVELAALSESIAGELASLGSPLQEERYSGDAGALERFELLVLELLDFNSQTNIVEEPELSELLLSIHQNIAAAALALIERVPNTAGCDPAHDLRIDAITELAVTVGAESELAALLNTTAGDLRQEIGNRFGCQLIINVTGFPQEIDSTGDATFNIDLVHSSSGSPLSGIRGTLIPLPAEGNCTLVNTFSSPIGFRTNISGRAEYTLEVSSGTSSEQLDADFFLTVGESCGSDPVSVMIFIESQHPPGELDLYVSGKTLLLSAPVNDLSLRMSPSDPTVDIGETVQFTAEAPSVDNPTFTWEATGGLIEPDGLYTAGAIPGVFDVTVTLVETGASLIGQITIDGTAISVSPASTTVSPGGTEQFSATVLGPADTSVTWSAQGGSIDQTGFYTASNNPGNFFVTATSVADSTVSAIAQVTISGDRTFDPRFNGGWEGDMIETRNTIDAGPIVRTCVDVNSSFPDNCVRFRFMDCATDFRSCTFTDTSGGPNTGLSITGNAVGFIVFGHTIVYDGTFSGDTFTGERKGFRINTGQVFLTPPGCGITIQWSEVSPGSFQLKGEIPEGSIEHGCRMLNGAPQYSTEFELRPR